MGNDLFTWCTTWLNDLQFPSTLNLTNIVLIPKCTHPSSMQDLRRIVLYNVVYKIMAKVLANRLKDVLPLIISDAQSAFVPGRSISDNVLTAFEVIHCMKWKTKGKKGNMALKIDISKAYDRIDRRYLEAMMRIMGFDSHFISIILLCVTSVQYFASINGELVGLIIPKRGLLQGDPLSPYLFIVCAEGLSTMLQQAEACGDLHGCFISRGALSISHLLFADDSLFFFNAFEQECCNMHSIMGEYENILGQAVNVQKLGIFFSGNVPEDLKSNISNILGVHAPLNTGRYLDFTNIFSIYTSVVFPSSDQNILVTSF